MSVSSQVTQNTYTCDSSTTVFAYTFPILLSSDIHLYLVNNTTSPATTTEITSGFTVDTSECTVTYSSAANYGSSYKIIVQRESTFDQETEFTNSGAFYAKTVEASLDKLTYMSQEVKRNAADYAEIANYTAEAEAYATDSAASATTATEQAAIATTKATEAATYATAAEASAASADYKTNAVLLDGSTAMTGTLTTPNIITKGPYVDARYYGLVGDGTTDDTSALSAALNSGYTKILIHAGAKVLITSAITVAPGVDVQVLGLGSVTFSINVAAGTTVFTFSNAVSFENIIFDFNSSYVEYAMLYKTGCGNISFKNITFQNVKDEDSSYSTILLYVNLSGNVLDIDGITFSSCYKLGNGTVGDSGGNLSGVFLGGTGNYANARINNLSVTEFHNIDSSGDILYEDTSAVYIQTPSTDYLNSVKISNAYGYNFGKRLIKVHASYVKIENVYGYSNCADCLEVIGFNDAQGYGSKVGCSVSHARAYGTMDVPFASSCAGTKWYDVISDTTGSTVSYSVGMLINGNYTEVDGFETSASYPLSIGSASQIITGTRLKNIKLSLTSASAQGLSDISSNIGISDLEINGLYIAVDSTTTADLVPLSLCYTSSSITHSNIKLKNIVIDSDGPTNAYGIKLGYCNNTVLENYSYTNSSSYTHFRTAIFSNCKNVTANHVIITGAAAIGVHFSTCTGKLLANDVVADSCTYAVYNDSSSVQHTVTNVSPSSTIGSALPLLTNPRTTYGTSYPTTGTWKLGDLCLNSSPSSGNYAYWQCIAAGTPGTWKGFGIVGQSQTAYQAAAAAVYGAKTYTITTNSVTGDTLTIGGVTLTATAAITDSTDYTVGSTIATTATNITTALNANSTVTAKYTATVSGAAITLTESAYNGNTPAAATYTGTIVVSNGTATTGVSTASAALTALNTLIADLKTANVMASS